MRMCVSSLHAFCTRKRGVRVKICFRVSCRPNSALYFPRPGATWSRVYNTNGTFRGEKKTRIQKNNQITTHAFKKETYIWKWTVIKIQELWFHFPNIWYFTYFQFHFNNSLFKAPESYFNLGQNIVCVYSGICSTCGHYVPATISLHASLSHISFWNKICSHTISSPASPWHTVCPHTIVSHTILQNLLIHTSPIRTDAGIQTQTHKWSRKLDPGFATPWPELIPKKYERYQWGLKYIPVPRMSMELRFSKPPLLDIHIRFLWPHLEIKIQRSCAAWRVAHQLGDMDLHFV